MKYFTATAISGILVLLLTYMILAVVFSAAEEVDVRGTVTNVGVNQFTWDNSSFAGIYYDIDKNLGAETITFSLTDATPTGATLTDQEVNGAPRGVVYSTHAQLKTFKYKPWGQYDIIGFLADLYFAAYDPTVTEDVTNAGAKVAYLFDASKNRNLMANEQISQVLMDDNKEMTITSANPLQLAQGYQLAIKSIGTDSNNVHLDLSKNGQVVDSAVVQPSIDNAKIADQTYFYRTSLGETTDIIQIAVHFKNAFAGTDTNIATVDGEFQISDTVTPLESGQAYDKMSIRTVDATNMAVTMDNKDNQITLSKNKDVVLMQNVHIKTADQDGTAATPLRYYIYKAITAPGSYQLRGTVSNVMQNQVTWDTSTFSGFYYDIDKNLGAETLTLRPTSATPTGATLSDQTDANNNRGVVYSTHAQLKTFKYKPWGQYDIIGFLANKYFAAYDPTVTANVAAVNESVAYLYDASKNRNLMTNEQISQVLVDDNKEQTITSANPLVLQQGYQLAIKSIDADNVKAYIELTKNGQVVDDKVVQPYITNSMMKDQTYYYKASLGDTTDIIQIAVHFKNAFRGADTNIATVDGEFQISDTATALKTDLQFDKMSIRNVDATGMTVTMDNKDNQITLSKNKDVVLMQDVHIKTADQDGTDAAPLRYYIYKAATITAGNVTAPVAPAAAPAANVTAPAKAENVTTPASAAPTTVIENKPPRIIRLDLKKDSEILKLNAIANDSENDTIMFQFILDNNSIIRGWGTENSCVYYLGNIQLGQHIAKVKATDNISAGISSAISKFYVFKSPVNLIAILLIIIIWILITIIVRNKEKLKNISISKLASYFIATFVCVTIGVLIQLSNTDIILRIILTLAIFMSLPFLYRNHRLIENLLTFIITWTLEHEMAAYAIPPLTYMISISELFYDENYDNLQKFGIFMLYLIIGVLFALIFEFAFCKICKKIKFIFENRKSIIIFLLIVSTMIAANVEREHLEINRGPTIVDKTNYPPMIEDLTFDRDPSINSGMPINCTVKANDNEGDSISFLFRLKGPSTGNTWLNETDWQLSNSWMCDTSNLSLGDYIINVLAKDNEHPAEMRCYASKNKTFYNPSTIKDLTFDRDPSIKSGTPINCIAKANNNKSDSMSFLFRLKGPSTGDTWFNETDWQLSNSWMCDTSNLSLGDYIINVLAKDNEHPAEMRFYASKNKIFYVIPHNYSDWYNQGYKLFYYDLTEEALENFNKSLNLNQSYAPAWEYKGRAFWNLGKNDAAIDCINTAINLSSQDAHLWDLRGSIMEYKDKDEALRSFDKAIELANKSIDYRVDKLNCLKFWGMGSEASLVFNETLSLLDKSIESDPNDIYLYNTKGGLLKNMGRDADSFSAYNEALSICDKSIESDPNNMYLYDTKGGLLKNMGRDADSFSAYNEALSICNKSIESDPNDINQWQWKESIFNSLGQTENAKEVHRKAEEMMKGLASKYRRFDE